MLIVSELYYESDQYKTGKAMDIFKNYCETKIKEFEPYLYTDEYGNSRKAEVLLEYSYFRGYKDGLIVDAPEIIDSQDGIDLLCRGYGALPYCLRLCQGPGRRPAVLLRRLGRPLRCL